MARRSFTMRGLVLLLAVSTLSGCSTYADHLREMRQEFYSGELTLATTRIDNRMKRSWREKDVLKLEKAMVELCSGRPKEAELMLREVRDQFDHLEQASIAEATASMLSDDNAMAYAGEDYEKVLIRAMLALSNMLQGGGDASAYSLQVSEKQNQIVDTGKDETGNNPKLAYKRVALGAYLQGVLTEESHMNYDDTARAWTNVVSWNPEFRHGQADLQRAVHGRHSAPGNGVLYVFAFVGEGPYKEETVEIPSTVAMLIADRIISHNANHTLPPTIAPIKVPAVVVPYSEVHTVHVSVNNRPVGETETVTDVGDLAVQQYEAVKDGVLARAVVRRAVKKGVIYASKESLNVNPWVSLGMDVAGVVWEAAEAADTRCWGLLPAKIQVLRIELPAGEHTVALSAGAPLGIASPYTATVQISNGRNTYLLANFPRRRLVGQIVTSNPYGLN